MLLAISSTGVDGVFNEMKTTEANYLSKVRLFDIIISHGRAHFKGNLIFSLFFDMRSIVKKVIGK